MLQKMPIDMQRIRLATLAITLLLVVQIAMILLVGLVPDVQTDLTTFTGILLYWSESIVSFTVVTGLAVMVWAAPYSGQRRFWLVCLLAMITSFLSGIGENVDFLKDQIKIFDLDDVPFLMGKFTILGLQFYALRALLRKDGFRPIAIDGFAAFLCVGTIIWFVLQNEFALGHVNLSGIDIAALILYACIEACTIFLFIVLLLRGDGDSLKLDRIAKSLVFVAFMCQSASVLVWATQKLRGLVITSVDHVSYILLFLSYYIFMLAMLRFLHRPQQAQEDSQLQAWLDEISTFGLVVVLLVVILILDHDVFQPIGLRLFFLLALTILVLILRQTVTMRSRIKLQTELAVRTAEVKMMAWYRNSAPPPDAGGYMQVAQLGKNTLQVWLSPEEMDRLGLLPYGRNAEPAQAMLSDILPSLRAALSRAIAEGWFVPWYQPIHMMADGSIYAVEVLARCEHPDHGILLPEDFINLIELTDLSGALVESLIEQVCSNLEELQKGHSRHEDIIFTLNFTASDFTNRALADKLIASLERHDIDPARMGLELTERAMVEQADQVNMGIERLRAMGMRVCIDDFGTGYSSLAYLSQLKVDVIKIDRSFITDLEVRASSADLVNSVILLAKRLNLEVIVEGIESEGQRRILLQQGCDKGQGYLWSHPMAFVLLKDFLRRAG